METIIKKFFLKERLTIFLDRESPNVIVAVESFRLFNKVKKWQAKNRYKRNGTNENRFVGFYCRDPRGKTVEFLMRKFTRHTANTKFLMHYEWVSQKLLGDPELYRKLRKKGYVTIFGGHNLSFLRGDT